jgi:hypothetical protein
MTSDAAIRSLKSEISGQVLTPVDGGFDAPRAVFNTMMRGRITCGLWREVQSGKVSWKCTSGRRTGRPYFGLTSQL